MKSKGWFSKRLPVQVLCGIGFLTPVMSWAQPMDAWLEQMPPKTAEVAAECYGAFSAQAGETARALVERLTGSEEDTAVHYALDGWTTYVLRPGAPAAERAALSAALLEALEANDSLEARRFILSQLGKVGIRETVAAAPLARMLQDPELGQAAGMALQAFAIPAHQDAALAAVRQALLTAEGDQRMVLLRLLGDLGDPEALARVATDLASTNDVLRTLALRAVAMSGDPDAADRLQGDAAAPFFGDYAQALAARGHRALAVKLCRELIEADPPEHRVCIALTTVDSLLGPGAVDELVAALDHSSDAVRARAAALLAASDADRVRPLLRRRLRGGEAADRAQALALLAQCGDPRLLRFCTFLANDEDELVRHTAYDVLARQPEAVSGALTLLGELDPPDRNILRDALLRYHGPAIASPAWQHLAAEKSPDVQVVWLELIAFSGNRAYAKNASTLVASEHEIVAKQAVDVLLRLAGPEHASDMLVLLRDAALTPALRSRLVSALVAALNEAPEESTRVQPIAAMLPQVDGEARRDLHRLLSGLDAADAVALLAADAVHESEPTRDSAVRALCKWDGMEAVEPLLDVARTATSDTHHGLALRRVVQLVQQYRAGDPNQEADLAEARAYYTAALGIVRRDAERTLVEEALAKLTPEEEAEPAETLP